jgi:putative FmdB family regulatory protein
MPLYEYQCADCNKRSEVLQRLGEAPITACPACGGPVKKLISSPSFQFKGSGWYATDYGRKSGGGGSDSSDSSSASKATPAGREGDGGKSNDEKSDSKADAKSTAKPETKSESKASAGSSES